ncbi:hypothetical protein EsH8_VI_000772 [Colletotrichum jinshuiense]
MISCAVLLNKQVSGSNHEVLLGESTKKFTSWSHSRWQGLTEAAIQMGGSLQALALLLWCDLLLVSDYADLCRSSRLNPAAKAPKVDVAPHIRECERLIQTARMMNYPRQEVEGHIFLAMLSHGLVDGPHLLGRHVAVEDPVMEHAPRRLELGLQRSRRRDASYDFFGLARCLG